MRVAIIIPYEADSNEPTLYRVDWEAIPNVGHHLQLRDYPKKLFRVERVIWSEDFDFFQDGDEWIEVRIYLELTQQNQAPKSLYCDL